MAGKEDAGEYLAVVLGKLILVQEKKWSLCYFSPTIN